MKFSPQKSKEEISKQPFYSLLRTYFSSELTGVERRETEKNMLCALWT